MTVPWAIRQIEDGDVAQVIALWSACGLVQSSNDPAADIALARHDPRATVIVGVAAGQIAGAAIVAEAAGSCGEAYYIAVDPCLQGQGLGRAIVMAAESWLTGRGVHGLRLRVEEANANAAAFYRHLGYHATNRLYMEKLWLGPGHLPA